MSEIYKLSGFQYELDKAERFFSMHLTRQELKSRLDKIERLNNIIKIMEKYFELILDLGYDYDGLNEKESLKNLIDELCKYASLGRAYNTTEIIYVNGDKKYNILNEELKGSDKE